MRRIGIYPRDTKQQIQVNKTHTHIQVRRSLRCVCDRRGITLFSPISELFLQIIRSENVCWNKRLIYIVLRTIRSHLITYAHLVKFTLPHTSVICSLIRFTATKSSEKHLFLSVIFTRWANSVAQLVPDLLTSKVQNAKLTHHFALCIIYLLCDTYAQCIPSYTCTTWIRCYVRPFLISSSSMNDKLTAFFVHVRTGLRKHIKRYVRLEMDILRWNRWLKLILHDTMGPVYKAGQYRS